MIRNAIPYLCVTAMLLFGSVTASHADWRDDIGWTQLLSERGTSLANGSGVVVSHIDSDGSGDYHPYADHPWFAGKTFVDGTGTGDPTNGASRHPEFVGFVFYGNEKSPGVPSSIASGISEIHVYDASDWVVNKLGLAVDDGSVDFGSDPVAQPFEVSNHSYIFNGFAEDDAVELLTKVDFLANQHNTTYVVGSTNVGTDTTRQGWAHNYNGITVGRSNGGHAHTPTTIYGAGRSKPELVGPGTEFGTGSSFTTAMTSGAAAILREQAKTISTNAIQNEVVKAQLLAGATKAFDTGWSRTSTQPLDSVFGAGQLNVRNSYLIQEGGEFDGSTTEPIASVGAFGWDYSSGITDPLLYDFEIGAGEVLDELSAILTWNIDVTDNDASGLFDPTTFLANMDLELYDSSSTFLGTLLDESVSTVDNVEHIYAQGLAAGRYTLRVTSDSDHDFALAWRFSTTAVPEPGMAMLGLFASGVCFFRRRRRI